MKQLKCEVCGSTDLLKQDGVFLCQSCGCKYTVEEAKKLMVEGTVEIKGKVQLDNSHLIENFLNMAITALDSSNNVEAEQYCNKVIEVDPDNYKAFLYKGTATAWQSTFAKLRIIEAINCWKTALNKCDEKDRNELLSYTDSNFRQIIIAMVKLAGGFVESGVNQYNGTSYREHLLTILNCIQIYTKSINPSFRGDRLRSEAAISVVPSLMKCAQSEERLYHKIKPSTAESYSDFVKEYLGCIDLLNMTATFGEKSVAKALCYQKAAEVMETINNLPFYIWVDGRYVPRQNPNKSFGSEVSNYRAKAAEARAKIEEEKKEEYWQDHPDEYKAYLKKQEEEKKKKEEAERIKRERAIKEENEKKKAKEDFWTSHNKELQELNAELRELEQKKSNLNDKKYSEPLLTLIKDRTAAIQKLLDSDRRGKSDFSADELAVVTGKESFNTRYSALLSDVNVQKNNATKKRNLFLMTGGLILLAVITFVIVLNSYIIPNSKYTSAIEKMNNGDYVDAYVLFNEVKTFKDSENYMKNMEEKNPLIVLSIAKHGDTFTFGSYEQDNDLSNGKEALTWIVLSQEDNKVLLITEKIIDGQPFNEKGTIASFSGSTLNSWLQSEFYNTAFNANEKAKISGDILIANKSQRSTYSIPVDAEPTAYAMSNGERYVVWYPDHRSYWTWWLSESTNSKGDAYVAHGGITDSNEKMGVRPMIWLTIEE